MWQFILQRRGFVWLTVEIDCSRLPAHTLAVSYAGTEPTLCCYSSLRVHKVHMSAPTYGVENWNKCCEQLNPVQGMRPSSGASIE